ncbi:MAG TPA: undecaprenyl-diphosphatase UppP [Actinomycetota bacterium]|jgi:undecaprenyl-diphosphatase|nr:undecaprenyl-diphosphatase UppP [Actinomycetota bacterium]
MSVWEAIVLGLVQGATEYAPVSSSGHLILVPWLFGWEQLGGNADFAKSFDVALHMGTLLGAVIYFRSDLWRYLKAWLRTIAQRAISTTDERIAWALVVGTIPGAIVGAVAEDVIQESLGAPALIAVMLAVFGIVLYVVDRRMPSVRDMDSIGVRTGLFLGVAQAMALQPGVSRSGVTMTAARAIGLDRETAARFSFLLSLPIIAGAGLYKGADLVTTGFQGYEAQFFWGFVSSAVSGFLVIWGLLKYLKRHDFKVFMLYRLAVAALVLGLVAAGVREATI